MGEPEAMQAAMITAEPNYAEASPFVSDESDERLF